MDKMALSEHCFLDQCSSLAILSLTYFEGLEYVKMVYKVYYQQQIAREPQLISDCWQS